MCDVIFEKCYHSIIHSVILDNRTSSGKLYSKSNSSFKVLSEFYFYASNRINYPQFYCQTAKEERNCIPLSLLMKRTEKIYFHISFQKVKLIQLQSDCEQLFQKQDSSEYTILAESMYKKKKGAN